MLPSHIIFAYFSRTTFSHATFAHCRLQYTFRRAFCTLFTYAIFACQLHTFFVRYFRKQLTNIILQHVLVPCLFARHFRIAFSHATFARSVLALISVRCVRYCFDICGTLFYNMLLSHACSHAIFASPFLTLLSHVVFSH